MIVLDINFIEIKICMANLNKKIIAKIEYAILKYLNFLLSTPERINITAIKDTNTNEISSNDILVGYFICVADTSAKILFS